MAKLENLSFAIVANGKQAIREIRQVRDETGRAAQTTEGRMARLGQRVRGFGLVGVVAVAAVGKAVVGVVDDLEDLKLAETRASTAFGRLSVDAGKFATAMLRAFGVARAETLTALVDLEKYADQAGLSGDAALQFAESNAELALQLAAVTGNDPSDALTSMMALFRGERDPIEKYGVAINDAALKQRALADGIPLVNGQLSTQDKILLTNKLLHEQTAEAVSNVEAAMDGSGAQARVFMGLLSDLAVRGFERLEGPIRTAVGWLETLNDLMVEDEGPKEAVRQAERVADGVANIADAWRETRDEVSTGVTGLRDDFGRLFGDSQINRDVDFKALRLLQEQLGLTDQQVVELARELEASGDISAESFGEIEGAIRATGQEAVQQSPSVQQLADAQRYAAEATAEHGDAAEKTTEELEAEAAALEKLIGHAQDYADAVDDAADAQADFDEVMTDSEATVEDRYEAGKDLARGLADEKTAWLNSRGAIQDANDELRNRIDAGLDVAGQMDGPERDALLRYIARQANVPEDKVTEFVSTFNTYGAERVIRFINSLPGAINIPVNVVAGSNTAGTAGYASARGRNASGGIAGGSFPEVAGENFRPELVNGRLVTGPTVLSAGDRVTGERETAGMLGGSRTVNQYVTINMPPGVTPAQVQSALRRYRSLEGGDL